MNISAELKNLKLPKNSYVVVGSGVLNALGIRASNDIDLIVNQEIYDKFLREGWSKSNWSDQVVLKKGIFDVGKIWYGNNVGQILERAQVIDDIPYLSIKDVYDWKQNLRREKDLNDLKLIDAYMSSR